MGLAVSFYSQTFPPPPHFNPDIDTPDLSGKVIIVTGGEYTSFGSRLLVQPFNFQGTPG